MAYNWRKMFGMILVPWLNIAKRYEFINLGKSILPDLSKIKINLTKHVNTRPSFNNPETCMQRNFSAGIHA